MLDAGFASGRQQQNMHERGEVNSDAETVDRKASLKGKRLHTGSTIALCNVHCLLKSLALF